MADYTYQHGTSATNDAGNPSHLHTKLVTWAGAVTSLALIAGVGVWSAQILVRDVSGVPVVRAIDGPMRVQPEPDQVGGKPAQHQGLAVNDVAAAGMAQNAPDQLTLAPQPVDISDNSPSYMLAELVAAAANEPLNGNLPAQSDVAAADTILAPALAPTGKPPTPAELLALVDQIANQTGTLSQAPVAIDTPEVVAATAPKSGLARSLRPKLRPQRLAKAVTPVLPSETLSDVVATSAISNGEVDASTLPAGTRLVQLGAYESSEIARTEWTRLSGKFNGYLDDKSRVVQRASSGGRTFYRLRAMGFEDLADARRFCSALIAENADCIPVVTR
jgi:hypothetical protein